MTGRISTVYNGVDLAVIQKAEADKELRDSIIASGGSVILIMVAGFRSPKDHETIIRSMTYLPDCYRLILAGSGSTLESSRRLTEALGINGRISFVGTRNDVASLLKAADICILSSHYEGFGLSAVEGMGAGLPLVASNVDALNEIVAGAAVLFNPGDPRGLADAVKRLASDPEYRSGVISKCIARARRFDLETMTEGNIDIYRRLLEA